MPTPARLLTTTTDGYHHDAALTQRALAFHLARPPAGPAKYPMFVKLTGSINVKADGPTPKTVRAIALRFTLANSLLTAPNYVDPLAARALTIIPAGTHIKTTPPPEGHTYPVLWCGSAYLSIKYAGPGPWDTLLVQAAPSPTRGHNYANATWIEITHDLNVQLLQPIPPPSWPL